MDGFEETNLQNFIKEKDIIKVIDQMTYLNKFNMFIYQDSKPVDINQFNNLIHLLNDFDSKLVGQTIA